MLKLNPLGNCTLNWIISLQVASRLLVGKGSSRRTGCVVRACDNKRTRNDGRWKMEWLGKQMDGLAWDSNWTFAVRSLRLSHRYGTAVFMTCQFCAQNTSLFFCFNKIIPQTASLISNAYIETQHQKALWTKISTFSVMTSFWSYFVVCVEMD